MASNLVIVESPSKAKTINKYLGKDYKVEASRGHIRDLAKGDDAVDVDHDFAMTYVIIDEKGKKEHVRALKKAAKEAETVWLATDMDREGEAIAWHLAEALDIPPKKRRRVVFNEITKKAIQDAFANPGQIDQDKVAAQEARRALDRLVGFRISPLLWTKIPGAKSAGRVQTVAVRLIVEREREIKAFVAQEYWRVGALLCQPQNGDRARAAFQTFVSAHKAAEVGEAESPDTDVEKSDAEPELVVSGAAKKELDALLREHGTFRAELFQYGIDRIANTAEAVKDKRGLLLDAARAKQMAEELRREAYVVTSIEKKERQDRPRPPFTTATIQQAASSQLRFPASKTMRLAQQLYEGVDLGAEGQVALITYMRTDSTFLSDQAIQEGRGYIGKRFGPGAVPDRPNHYAPKATAQGAHEAIRPTEPGRTPESLQGSLDKDQLALYRLIWTRFIACQMKPAIWNVTEVQVAAGKGLFRASGRELKFPGYTALTGVYDDDSQMLPALAEKDRLALVNLAETKHATQPPPRFTEAGLVKELEKQGIGRPSTYANIIQTIQDRNYVREQERKFFPTFLGNVLIDNLIPQFPKTFEVKFTSEMEGELDEIETAKRDRVSVLNDFWKPFKAAVDHAKKEMPRFAGVKSDIVCEKCGSPMEYRLNKEGEPFLGCTRYDRDNPENSCGNRLAVDPFGKPKEKGKETEIACEKCGRPMVLRSTSRGKGVSYFLGCSGYGAKENPCENTKPSDSEGNPLQVLTEEKFKELGIKCTECGKPMALKKGRFGPFLGCTGHPDCKSIQKLPAGYFIPRPPPELTAITCEKCGKPLAVRAFGGRKFLGCTGFPKCRNAKPYALVEAGYTGVAPSDKPKATEPRGAKAKTAAKAKSADKGDAADEKPAKKPAAKKKATAKKAAADEPEVIDDAAFDANGVEIKAPAASNGSTVDDAPFDADGFEAPTPRPAKAAKAPQPEIAMNPDAGDWGKCPDCGKPLAIKPGKWGPFLGCTGFPKCKKIVTLKGDAKKKAMELAPMPKREPPQKTDVPCPNCGELMVVRAGRSGKFLGCSAYPKCKTTQPLPDGLVTAEK